MKDKKKILIVMGRYLPGFRDGGPVRSTKNLVDQLGTEYDIRVVAYDRDVGDVEQYPNISLYDWNRVGNALVYYVPEHGFTYKVLKDLASQVDLVYLWGCFNKYTIKLLLLKRLGLIKKPVVIAGMGLFSPMAFKIKYRKKKVVTTVMNLLGLFKNVFWSATSEMEVQEIQQQVWTKDEHFFIAEDLPRKVDETPIKKEKKSGELKVVWISRIAPKKNLIAAIRILQQISVKIEFTIYGPIFDSKYWEECERELGKLPQNIEWRYKGNVDSELVVQTLKKHHVFLFPTLGENYGHVIQEALSAGCPCILSDQTPWKDLEKEGVGYIYPVDSINEFVYAMETYAQMNENEYRNCSSAALEYAIKNSNKKSQSTGYRKIFDTL